MGVALQDKGDLEAAIERNSQALNNRVCLLQVGSEQKLRVLQQSLFAMFFLMRPVYEHNQ